MEQQGLTVTKQTRARPPRAERLRPDVEALCELTRDSAGEGERRAAEWIGKRLRDAGAHEVAYESFRSQRRWFGPFAAHLGAGIGAAAVGGAAGAAAALATAVSFEAETSGRVQWIRPLLPAGEGTNVWARVPAAGSAGRTLVFVSHHDAQRAGWLWRSPFITDSPASISPLLSLLGIAAGSLVGSRALRIAGAGGLAFSVIAAADVARSKVVPGANDNATGVAALLALAEAFARDPLESTDVVLLSTGCEEVGTVGMAAWMKQHGDQLDPATTLVVSLDTLGSGEPVVATKESAVLARYHDEDLDWIDRGALRAAVNPPRRVPLALGTDAIQARFAGLRAISLLSHNSEGRLANYHQTTDTPENVDWDSVDACTRLAWGTARVWDAVA